MGYQRTIRTTHRLTALLVTLAVAIALLTVSAAPASATPGVHPGGDWIDVAAGRDHTCALSARGRCSVRATTSPASWATATPWIAAIKRAIWATTCRPSVSAPAATIQLSEESAICVYHHRQMDPILDATGYTR